MDGCGVVTSDSILYERHEVSRVDGIKLTIEVIVLATLKDHHSQIFKEVEYCWNQGGDYVKDKF